MLEGCVTTLVPKMYKELVRSATTRLFYFGHGEKRDTLAI